MKILVCPAIQRSCSIKRGWKGLPLTWPLAPFVVHCPKSLVLKSFHRANTSVACSVTSIALCPINWVNILSILNLFFWLHRMLASFQTCWVPNPGLIEIKKKKINERKNVSGWLHWHSPRQELASAIQHYSRDQPDRDFVISQFTLPTKSLNCCNQC